MFFNRKNLKTKKIKSFCSSFFQKAGRVGRDRVSAPAEQRANVAFNNKQLMLLILTTVACAPTTEPSKVSSFQARVDNNYRYILTHTAPLDSARDRQAGEIAGVDFSNYGQCFYRVVSPQKLRLHRQDDLQQALATATVINDHYLPLSTVEKIIKRDRTLQELYASERHWLLPTVSSFLVFPAVMSVDMLLHKGNGIIVDNSEKEIIDKFVKGDKTLRKDIYQALHLTAKVEHETDSLVQEAMTFASKERGGTRKAIRKALVDSRFAEGFAELTKKKCLGKRAAICLVGYLAFFNSLFAVALPVLSDRLGNSLARFVNRNSERETLQNLLNDRDPLTQTQATSDKVIKRFEKKIKRQQVTGTASCPDAQTIGESYLTPANQLSLEE